MTHKDINMFPTALVSLIIMALEIAHSWLWGTLIIWLWGSFLVLYMFEEKTVSELSAI